MQGISELIKLEFQKADILINVVGGIRDKSLTRSILKIDEERWDQTMALNLKGCLNCTKLIAPIMLKNR
ncbi:SDR family NAD(P)-dependent oxidoreductase [Bacillus sp. OK048]|uniref:SDR family NAD(P)-dependent oxidoreductase n=1 Tax=Bacillus sp. OK048 TaxID=1882761 RepID=UPI000B8A38A8